MISGPVHSYRSIVPITIISLPEWTAKINVSRREKPIIAELPVVIYALHVFTSENTVTSLRPRPAAGRGRPWRRVPWPCVRPCVGSQPRVSCDTYRRFFLNCKIVIRHGQRAPPHYIALFFKVGRSS